ncbi:Fungal potassium channel [Nakaseomyces glabratus]|nr:Fungal potassium channel [Nakaseomyces glabratus]KAH7614759.1 Fungal potassium channel [Nakaseomyces glabratus]
MLGNDWKYSINSRTFDDLEEEEFKNYKFKTVLSYIFEIGVMNGLKVAFFVSDIYTCVKLLAYNSWSNNVIKPYISFKVTKWLFTACIFASIVILLIEAAIGFRIYRTRNISLTYVNNFSRNTYSIKSYSKFCVYNKITPKGFFQKVSFFTFFELRNCIRLLFTDTPRQVFNALTLWSVLVTVNNGADLGRLETFHGLINKIKTIADTNHAEAVILSFMLFSFVLWAFFMFKFCLALLSSIFVYYNLIRRHRYGSLKAFVCITIDKKVDEMVKQHKSKSAFQNITKTTLLQSNSMLDIKQDLEKNTAETTYEIYKKPNYDSVRSNLHLVNSNIEEGSTSEEYELMYEEPMVRNSVIDGNDLLLDSKFNAKRDFNQYYQNAARNQSNSQDVIKEEYEPNFDVMDYAYSNGSNECHDDDTVWKDSVRSGISDNINYGHSSSRELDDVTQSVYPPQTIEISRQMPINMSTHTLEHVSSSVTLDQQPRRSRIPPPPIKTAFIDQDIQQLHVYTPDQAYFNEFTRNQHKF